MEDFAVAKLQAASKFPYLKEMIMEMPIVVVDHPMLPVAGLSKRMVMYVDRRVTEEDILLLPFFIIRDMFHLVLHHADRYEQFKVCSPETWTIAARMALYSFMKDLGALSHDFAKRFLIDPIFYGLPYGLTVEDYVSRLSSSSIDQLPKEAQNRLNDLYRKLQEIKDKIRSADDQSNTGESGNASECSNGVSNTKSGGNIDEDIIRAHAGSAVHGQPQPWESDTNAAPSQQTVSNLIDIARETIMHLQRGTSRGNVLRELEEFGCNASIGKLIKLLTDARRMSHKSGSSNLDITRVRRRQYVEQYRMGYVIPPYTGNYARVGVLIDTSGSMELEHELRMCIQCVNAFVRNDKYSEIMFYSGDTDVNSVQKLCRGQKPILIGEGGTDVGKMIKQIEEMNQGKPLDYLIVFTDGWTPWGEEPKTTKVIAVITKPDHWQIPDWVQYVMLDDLFPHLKRK